MGKFYVGKTIGTLFELMGIYSVASATQTSDMRELIPNLLIGAGIYIAWRTINSVEDRNLIRHKGLERIIVKTSVKSEPAN